MSYGVILAKILPQRYMTDFLDGNLYMNTDEFFTETESVDVLRSDIHEGVDEARQFKRISIKAGPGIWTPIEGALSPLMYRYGGKEVRHVLCMYMFTDKPNFRFDQRNIGFGDAAVLITDLKEFVRRIKTAAEATGKRLLHGPVEYVDKHFHDGQMGPFRKFSEYEYQSEFRFVMIGTTGESRKPIRLSVGSIRDIVMVSSSAKLPDLPIAQGSGNRK